MAETKYGYTTRLEGLTFANVLKETTDALRAQGFGVLTEIDVKATMAEKLGVDFRQYKILGACNPSFAHQALGADLYVGLLLPCNVAVFEEDDGSIVVSAVKPEEMFRVVDKPELEPIATSVGQRLRAVIGRLEELGAKPS